MMLSSLSTLEESATTLAITCLIMSSRTSSSSEKQNLQLVCLLFRTTVGHSSSGSERSFLDLTFRIATCGLPPGEDSNWRNRHMIRSPLWCSYSRVYESTPTGLQIYSTVNLRTNIHRHNHPTSSPRDPTPDSTSPSWFQPLFQLLLNLQKWKVTTGKLLHTRQFSESL